MKKLFLTLLTAALLAISPSVAFSYCYNACGDGAGGSSDDLGNHTATQDIEVGGFSIDGSSGLAFDPDNDGTNEINMTSGGDITVADEVYDATGWNGSLEVPTKNAVRDKIEAISVGGGGGTTDGGTTTYVTGLTDDFAIGGTGSTAAIFADESNETMRARGGFIVGDDTDANHSVMTVQLNGSTQTITWDDVNKEWDFSAPINASGTGPSALQQGLTVNDGAGSDEDDDFIVKADTITVIETDAGDETVTGLGTWNLGGATAFELPNGTGPTVSLAGQAAVDTTDDQFIYYGSAKRVLSYEIPRSAVIESLAAADDDMPLGTTHYARTITEVGCRCVGTCSTAAQISLEDNNGNAMTHTTPTCATSGTVTLQSVSSGGGLTAGEGLAFDVDNTPDPETDTYEVIWVETIDAQ